MTKEKIEGNTNEAIANCVQLSEVINIQPMIRIIRGKQVMLLKKGSKLVLEVRISNYGLGHRPVELVYHDQIYTKNLSKVPFLYRNESLPLRVIKVLPAD